MCFAVWYRGHSISFLAPAATDLKALWLSKVQLRGRLSRGQEGHGNRWRVKSLKLCLSQHEANRGEHVWMWVLLNGQKMEKVMKLYYFFNGIAAAWKVFFATVLALFPSSAHVNE